LLKPLVAALSLPVLLLLRWHGLTALAAPGTFTPGWDR